MLVAGYCDNANDSAGRRIFLVKYSRSGTQLQGQTWTISGGTGYQACGLALDPVDSTAYVGGSFVTNYVRKGVIFKVTPSGGGSTTSYTYAFSTNFEFDQIVTDRYTGYLYLSGIVHQGDGTNDQAFVVRQNTTLSGGAVWSSLRTIGVLATNPGLTVEPSRTSTPYALFVTHPNTRPIGREYTNYMSVERFDERDGTLDSTFTAGFNEDGQTGSDGTGGILVDTAGNLAISGVKRTLGGSSGYNHFAYWLLRMDAVYGTILSNNTLDAGDNSSQHVSGMAVDPNGNYRIVGDVIPGGSGPRVGDVTRWSSSGVYSDRVVFSRSEDITTAAIVFYTTSGTSYDIVVSGPAVYNGTTLPYLERYGSVNWNWIGG